VANLAQTGRLEARGLHTTAPDTWEELTRRALGWKNHTGPDTEGSEHCERQRYPVGFSETDSRAGSQIDIPGWLERPEEKTREIQCGSATRLTTKFSGRMIRNDVSSGRRELRWSNVRPDVGKKSSDMRSIWFVSSTRARFRRHILVGEYYDLNRLEQEFVESIRDTHPQNYLHCQFLGLSRRQTTP
jgi:hypothetical protein